jgi:SPP1 family predicted phage head-tail adaptor
MPYQRTPTPIGSRRELVRLQRPSTSDDGMGGQGPGAWTDVAQPWANVTPLDDRSREMLAANQITALHAYHVDIRYRTGVRPTMRLLWRDKTLQIQSLADDDQRRRRLILLCTEVQ